MSLRDRLRDARIGLVLFLACLALAIVLPTPSDADDGERAEPTSRGAHAAVESLAAQYFPSEWVGWAVRTAACESSLNPNADSNPPYVGYWQIDPGLHAWRVVRLFGRWRSLYDPEVNAAVAADILADQGPGAWPICGRR